MQAKWMRKRSHSIKSPLRWIGLVVTAAVCIFTFNTTAMAALEGSAGNTIIRNTVTVNYEDGGGTAQTPISATIDVTVNTIDVAPTVVSFSPSPGTTDGTGSTETYDVVIRTNSNGPAVITLAATDGSATNITLDTANPPSLASGGTLFLGATVVDPTDSNGTSTIADGTNITLEVPNDGGLPSDTAATGGSSGDGVINGLTAGDTVYLHDGTDYFGPFTIPASGVSDPATGSGTTAQPGSLTLTNDSGSDISITIAPGWMILEAKTDTMTVTQGVVAVPTTAASWNTTVTATMNGNDGSGTVTTNATGAVLTVSKYVRNVTDPNGSGTAQTISVSGSSYTFFESGVSGDPGDTLEYALVIENGSLGATQDVIATDPVPTYTTLSTFTGGYGGSSGTGSGSDVFAVVDDGNDSYPMTVATLITKVVPLAPRMLRGLRLVAP